MALTNLEAILKDCELKHCLPQIYRAFLTAACLSCPSDPIEFVKKTLMLFQGHDNLQDVDWYKFFTDIEAHAAKVALKPKIVTKDYSEVDDDMVPFSLLEKAYNCYRKDLMSSCFRKWMRMVVQRRAKVMEPAFSEDIAKTHFERRCQRVALTKWMNYVKVHKERKAAAIKKLQTVTNKDCIKLIVTAWRNFAKDTKRTKEYLKRLEMNFNETSNKYVRTGGRYDGLSKLPCSLSLQIFQYLEFQDLLSCAEVCYTWRSIIQCGKLWSQINFCAGKDWITDSTMKQVLQDYHLFVIHLNLRGCTSLTWSSMKCISECKNLQELNVSECLNVTDMMIQRIVEGCPCLLYLNLSYTLVTNTALKALSRSCVNLQYLSVAYCYRLTDEGFFYLSAGKGCNNLVHLDLSGCAQMTVNGFRHVSTGCPSLKEVVINDMPTLSDGCVLALLAKCRSLSAVSLLDAPHLSDVTLKAIAAASDLKSFSTEGNNQFTDVSWKSLCSSSRGLRRLRTSDCPRMTDASLKAVAGLKNLRFLDISRCTRVSNVGIKHLTEGASAAKLQELNVSHCHHIADVSAMRIAQRLCKLFHLDVSYCERLTDVSLGWLSGSSVRSLDISGCNIQNQGLANLEGIRLKKLVLAECVYVTDAGIETLCKNVRDLEHLDVSHCVALSDAAVRAVSFYCRGLIALQMAGCIKISDLAVQYLACGSQYLQELDVSGCVRLTDQTLKFLDRMCPPLRSITMKYCSGISRANALKLQPRVAEWEHSGEDPPRWFECSTRQIVHPVTTPIKTNETLEVVERQAIATSP